MSDQKPPYESRLPSGEWRCVLDHRTEPCGDCSGCREVRDENRIAQNDQSQGVDHA